MVSASDAQIVIENQRVKKSANGLAKKTKPRQGGVLLSRAIAQLTDYVQIGQLIDNCIERIVEIVALGVPKQFLVLPDF